MYIYIYIYMYIHVCGRVCVRAIGYNVHSCSRFRTVGVVYIQVCVCVHFPGYKVHSYSQFRAVSLTCDSSRLLVTRWAELALETRISCRSVAKKGSAWQQDLFRLSTLCACNFTVWLTFDRLMSAGDGTHHACMLFVHCVIPSMS